MKNYTHALIAAMAIALAPAAPSLAHHSTAPYDHTVQVEASGVIKSVNWVNPHITMTLVANENGKEVVWQIEANSVSSVTRTGLTAGLIKPGTQVKIAGHPDKSNPHAVWLNNILLPDGREILMGKESKPHWSKTTVGGHDIEGEVSKDAPELGLFRIWTSIGRGEALWKGQTSFPLTPKAAALQAKFNPKTDSPIVGCTPKGMPLIMEQPYPMEFVKGEDEIVMRLEEFDTVRHVAMSDAQKKKVLSQKPSLLGNSVGHWDGKTLVIETSGISYKYFNKYGIEQSPQVRIVERFTPTEDGSRLDYEMTVTDPATFTKPVVLGRSWDYRPKQKIQKYDCMVK